jgi:hypothetical protein
MGILDDTVQLETGTWKVWGSRSDRRKGQVNSTAHYGHLEGHGSIKNIKGGTNESALITAVPEGEENMKGQGMSMHQWDTTEGVYSKGRGSVAYRFDRINLHGSNSGK